VASPEYISLITVRSDGHAVSGTLMTIGTRVETRIVSVDGHAVEIAPTASMLVVHNDDRPGMIGRVGMALGEAISPSRHGRRTRSQVQDGAHGSLDARPHAGLGRRAVARHDGIQDIHLITLR